MIPVCQIETRFILPLYFSIYCLFLPSFSHLKTTSSKRSFLFSNLTQELLLYFIIAASILYRMLFQLYNYKCICDQYTLVSQSRLQKEEIMPFFSHPRPCSNKEILIEGMSKLMFILELP